MSSPRPEVVVVASRQSTRARRRWPWLLLLVMAMIAVLAWPSPPRSVEAPAAAPTAGTTSASGARPAGDGSRGEAHAVATVRASGRVVDDRDQPVAGVEVVFEADGAESSTPSGVDGRYAIDVAPGMYRAYVRAEDAMSLGWRPSSPAIDGPAVDDLGDLAHASAVEVDVRQDAEGIDLVVVRTGIIEGRVVDAGGRPVAGAVVRARAVLDRDRRSVVGDDLTETAADGSFRLQAPPGTVELRASHPAFARADTQDSTDVDVEVGAVTHAQVVLVAGCVVRGRVVGRDGAPVGAGIIKVDYGRALGADGRIEADGSFRWDAAVEGDVLLSAHPWGAPPSESRPFPCRDGARFDGVELEIAAAVPDLEGTLRTARGAPAAGAYLEIEDEQQERWARIERAGDDGRWAVAALPPGNYRVTARLEGEGVVRRDVTVPARDVALRFGGTGSLAGRVEGLDRGTVEIEVGPCEGARRTEHDAAASWRSIAVVNGRYRLRELPACSLELTVYAGGKARRLVVDVRADAVTELDVTFPPPEPEVPRERDSVIRWPMV